MPRRDLLLLALVVLTDSGFARCNDKNNDKSNGKNNRNSIPE